MFAEVYNTENFVSSRFVRSGTNGSTKGKFFFMLFAGGCFNEVATRSKSYWKHCYLEATFINWTKRQRITFDWEKSCIQPTVKTAHTLQKKGKKINQTNGCGQVSFHFFIGFFQCLYVFFFCFSCFLLLYGNSRITIQKS